MSARGGPDATATPGRSTRLSESDAGVRVGWGCSRTGSLADYRLADPEAACRLLDIAASQAGLCGAPYLVEIRTDPRAPFLQVVRGGDRAMVRYVDADDDCFVGVDPNQPVAAAVPCDQAGRMVILPGGDVRVSAAMAMRAVREFIESGGCLPGCVPEWVACPAAGRSLGGEEYATACTLFAATLVRAHQPLPPVAGETVARCSCGRAARLCEITAAALDADLFTATQGLPAAVSPGPATVSPSADPGGER